MDISLLLGSQSASFSNRPKSNITGVEENISSSNNFMTMLHESYTSSQNLKPIAEEPQKIYQNTSNESPPSSIKKISHSEDKKENLSNETIVDKDKKNTDFSENISFQPYLSSDKVTHTIYNKKNLPKISFTIDNSTKNEHLTTEESKNKIKPHKSLGFKKGLEITADAKVAKNINSDSISTLNLNQASLKKESTKFELDLKNITTSQIFNGIQKTDKLNDKDIKKIAKKPLSTDEHLPSMDYSKQKSFHRASNIKKEGNVSHETILKSKNVSHETILTTDALNSIHKDNNILSADSISKSPFEIKSNTSLHSKDRDISFTIPSNSVSNIKDAKAIVNNPILNQGFQEQLNDFIKKSRISIKDNDNATMTANLYPKELGKVSINLSIVDGVLQGSFIVQNESVQKALNEKMDSFIHDLRSDGHTIHSFDVNVESESSPQNSNGYNVPQAKESINYFNDKDTSTVQNTKIGGLYA